MDIRAATIQAIGLLDRTEPLVRDAIERNLFDVAGVNNTQRTAANAAMTDTMEEIRRVRTAAFVSIQRLLKYAIQREHHAKFDEAITALYNADLARIRTSISIAFTRGASNTDIAHSVIGSRRFWGANGSTEITRQQLLRLTRGYLHRKDRMADPTSQEN